MNALWLALLAFLLISDVKAQKVLFVVQAKGGHMVTIKQGQAINYVTKTDSLNRHHGRVSGFNDSTISIDGKEIHFSELKAIKARSSDDISKRRQGIVCIAGSVVAFGVAYLANSFFPAPLLIGIPLVASGGLLVVGVIKLLTIHRKVECNLDGEWKIKVISSSSPM